MRAWLQARIFIIMYCGGAQMSGLQQRIKEAEQGLQRMEHLVRELSHELDEARKKLAGASQGTERVTQMNADAQQQIAKAYQLIARLEEHCRVQEAERDDLYRRLTEANLRIKRLEGNQPE